MKHSCSSTAFTHIIHMQMEASAVVMARQAYCRNVRHLCKCCLSVTVGICRRNFAVRHLVIDAAAEAPAC